MSHQITQKFGQSHFRVQTRSLSFVKIRDNLIKVRDGPLVRVMSSKFWMKFEVHSHNGSVESCPPDVCENLQKKKLHWCTFLEWFWNISSNHKNRQDFVVTLFCTSVVRECSFARAMWYTFLKLMYRSPLDTEGPVWYPSPHLTKTVFPVFPPKIFFVFIKKKIVLA